MNRRSAAVATRVLVLVSLYLWQSGVASAQGSVQACMNPNSGEIKVLVKGGSCKAGEVTLDLATGGGADDGRGPRVVDANNEDVGAYLGGTALRHVPPYWLLLPVAEGGFRTLQTEVDYLSADCSGPGYIHAEEGALARTAVLRDDGLLHFAGDPIALLTVGSARGVQSDGSLGACNPTLSFTSSLGPETAVDPATFGLTPPFRLVDP